MSMWYITARDFGQARTHTTQRRDREGARASCESAERHAAAAAHSAGALCRLRLSLCVASTQQGFWANEVRHLKRKNLFILGVPGGGHADERLMTIKRRVGSSTQGSGARPVKQ